MFNHVDKKHKNRAKFSRFIKSKLNHKSKKTSKPTYSPDNFIKQYAQANSNNLTDIKSLDIRRKIFISLLGLFQTWKQCPLVTLYSSIFLLPLKKDWIYNPSKYTDELRSVIISQMSVFFDLAETNQFIEMLKWKDSQGLVFWMLDEYKHTSQHNNCIHPFWYHVNNKLATLYDPITDDKYNSIILDNKWWLNKEKYTSKYNVKASYVLNELYLLTMKFSCIKEVLHQSNPKSFDVITSYQNDACMSNERFKLYKFDENKDELVLTTESELEDHESDEGDNGNNWWVSEEYDPYDTD